MVSSSTELETSSSAVLPQQAEDPPELLFYGLRKSIELFDPGIVPAGVLRSTLVKERNFLLQQREKELVDYCTRTQASFESFSAQPPTKSQIFSCRDFGEAHLRSSVRRYVNEFFLLACLVLAVADASIRGATTFEFAVSFVTLLATFYLLAKYAFARVFASRVRLDETQVTCSKARLSTVLKCLRQMQREFPFNTSKDEWLVTTQKSRKHPRAEAVSFLVVARLVTPKSVLGMQFWSEILTVRMQILCESLTFPILICYAVEHPAGICHSKETVMFIKQVQQLLAKTCAETPNHPRLRT